MRKTGDVIVKKIELAQGGEHAELRRDGSEVIAREVKHHEVSELCDLCWDGAEGVVIEVESGEVGEPKEARGEVFETDAAQIERCPC